MIISVVIWGTVITGLQWLGYSIATVGLIYYSLGWDGIKQVYLQGQTIWDSRGHNLRGPRLTAVMLVGAVSIFLLVVWWSGSAEVASSP